MAMLDDVKNALDIALPVTIYDKDLSDLVDAAKLDLHMCGIAKDKITDENKLISRAVIFYCKAYFKKSDENEHYKRAY